MPWDIVARRFSPDDFDAYVSSLRLGEWKPDLIVLHNTAAPSLAQRPHGFTPQHIQNLHGYYVGKKWSGGPHLFVDQNGIWVFNPLNRKGVHSPSWNRVAWGIEMLGEYGSEPFHSGPGARVRDNTVPAIASLCRKRDFGPGVIRFHKEDPGTTHTTCPGRFVEKAWVLDAVTKALQPAQTPAAKLVIYRHGMGDDPVAVIPAEMRGSVTFASSHAMSQATGVPAPTDELVSIRAFLGSRYSLKWNATTRRVYAVEE